MPLRLSDGNLGVLNRWARRIEYETVTRSGRTFSKISKQPVQPPDEEPAPDTTIPPMPTNVIAAESGRTVNGTLYSDIYCAYTAPSPKGSFTGVYLVASGYKGSSALVKLGEHSYAGAAGGNASFVLTVDKTDETLTLYFVPKNNVGGTPTDWLTCPSYSVTLDGVSSQPLPPRNLQLTSFETGVALVWTENIEPDVTTYEVYRNDTSEEFSSATKIADVAATHQSTGTYTDNVADKTKPHVYWLIAVNGNAQSSAPSEPEPLNVIKGGNNEVLNSGFESWMLCWTTPTGVTWLNDPDAVQSGIGCAKIDRATAGSVTFSQKDAWGNTYYIPLDTANSHLRVWSNVNVVSGSATLDGVVRFYNASKALLSTVTLPVLNSTGGSLPSNKWVTAYSTVETPLPAGAVYIQLDLKVTSTGAATVRLDNARISTYTPVELPEDPGTL